MVALVVSDTAHDGLTWLIAASEPLIASSPALGAGVFVGLAALSAMLAFFSSAVLVPVALQAWGFALTAGLLWVGWTLGGVGAYAVARLFGRPVVARLGSPEALARYESAVTARSPFALVLLFQLAMPSEVPGYVLGLARYPPGRFLLALALAETPFAVLTVYVGAGLVERRLPLLVAAGMGALALSAVTLFLFRRRIPSRANHGTASFAEQSGHLETGASGLAAWPSERHRTGRRDRSR